MTTLGVLHPGTMGAALAASAVRSGTRVVWASHERSRATAIRAQAAGADDVGSMDALCADSDIVMSICPPASAEAVAAEVAAAKFVGTYVDANAISPGRMAAINDLLSANGSSVVDGAVFGPPPWKTGTSRIYLAGEAAAQVAALFSQGPVQPIVLDGSIGSASALKMAYSASQKGLTALTALCIAMADRYGVEDLLATEWDRSEPGVTATARRRIAVAVPKAWRWIGEMQEVADTALSAGLPDGFHRAAAEVYERWRAHKDPQGSRDAIVQDVGAVIRELSQDRGTSDAEVGDPGAGASVPQ